MQASHPIAHPPIEEVAPRVRDYGPGLVTVGPGKVKKIRRLHPEGSTKDSLEAYLNRNFPHLKVVSVRRDSIGRYEIELVAWE